MEVSTAVTLITPDLARQYLANNAGNRDMRPANVRQFEEQIKAGTFLLTHQGIALDETGRLMDGQHRLQAIVNTGQAVQMNVTTGLESAAFAVIDRGAKRTASDILRCSPKVAEVSTLAIRIISSKNSASLRHDELQEMHAKLGEESADLLRYCNTTAVYFSSAPVRLAAVVRILDGDDKEYVHDLYSKLCRAEISELPAVASLWMSQHIKGKLQALDKNDTIARALYCLDKTKRNASRIRELEEGDMRSYLRAVINAA